MSSWRRPEFVQEVKETVHPKQFERFKKMFHEPFFLLDVRKECVFRGTTHQEAPDKMVFTVSGSQQTPYLVTLLHRSRAFSCNCLDFRTNCQRNRFVCKHICFVLFRALRKTTCFKELFLDEQLSHHQVDAIFSDEQNYEGASLDNRVSEQDIDEMCSAMMSTSIASPSSSSSSTSLQQPERRRRQQQQRGRLLGLQEASASSTNLDKFKEVRRTPSDDCPICYDTMTLDDPTNPLLGCPDCGNGVHEECVRRWLAHATKKTCVFCRSAVWAAF